MPSITMTPPPVRSKGTCTCGAVTITAYTSPMLVFNCHCSKCRAFTGEPYSSSSMFWKCAIRVDGEDHIEYQRTFAQYGMIGLSRGRCRDCRDPVIDVGRRLLGMFHCPSATVLHLVPTTNIMYNSGEQQGTMGLTTYRSDFMSSIFVFPIIFYKGFPQLLYLFWAWACGCKSKAE